MLIETTYEKALFELRQLRHEFNNCSGLQATCISTTDLGTGFIGATWNQELTPAELILAQQLVDEHVPDPVPDIPVSSLPVSELSGSHLLVHSTSKPRIKFSEVYTQWAGSGDDNTAPTTGINQGELLEFNMTPEIPSKEVRVYFNEANGRAWIHEAYLNFNGGGPGDTLSSTVVATATPLQQSTNLDYVIDNDNWVCPAPGGPGTGTHGFAGAPSLVKRSFAHNGKWNYDPASETPLTPNLESKGYYNITATERIIHQFFNRLPIQGNSYGFTTLTSDEAVEIHPNYYIAVTVTNASASTFYVTAIMELYRQRTFSD